MRGNIVAPVQLLVVLGLKNAGKVGLARMVAERYLNFAGKNGLALMLPPFTADPATGLPVKSEERYDPDDRGGRERPADRFKHEKKEVETVHAWTSWAAANYLTIAAILAEGQAESQAEGAL